MPGPGASEAEVLATTEDAEQLVVSLSATLRREVQSGAPSAVALMRVALPRLLLAVHFWGEQREAWQAYTMSPKPG